MEKKTSVLIIGINFFPEPTGIGKYTAEFAFSLAEKGYEVEVITAYPYYPNWKVFAGYKNGWYKKETLHGVKLLRCPFYVPQKLSGLHRMLQDFSFFLSGFFAIAGKLLSGKKYDLVFVPSPSFMSGFLGVVYRTFKKNSRFVYHIQDLQIDAAEELGMIKSSALLRLLKGLERIILKRADWVTTISEGMAAKIKAKPVAIRRQYIFPNWVDFSKIYKKQSDESVISQLGIPVDKKMCFYSGAVGEKQGLEVIIEVAERALVLLPDLIFVIAGSGPYAQVLRAKAADKGLTNLYFIELQPLDVFNELLNHAYLHLVIQKEKASDLLLPSKLTNILAVEGLAVITASPGTSLYKIIHSNNAGLLIPPDDANALWEAINSSFHEQGKTFTIKQNAGNYARRSLEKNGIINSFLNELNLR